MRSFQRGVVAAGAIILAVGLTACGSDDDTADVGGGTTTTSTATANSSSAAPDSSSATTDSSTAPTAAELQSTLALIVDPARPMTERTAVIVNGDARTANLDAVAKALANYGQITFVIDQITVTGNTATAQVQITSPHGTLPTPMSWEQVDGTWKLSDASACQILAMGGVACT
jgi:hypothetical protein